MMNRDQQIISIAINITPPRVHPNNLLRARDDVREAIQILDLQIADLRERLTGSRQKQPDARWLARATENERKKVRQRVDLQHKLGDLGVLIRAQNREQSATLQDRKRYRFHELVKARLGDEAYRQLWAIVNAEFEGSDDAPSGQANGQDGGVGEMGRAETGRAMGSTTRKA